MAAGNFIPTTNVLKKLVDGGLDWDNASLYAVLLNPSFSYNRDTMGQYSNVSANEITDGGYVRQDLAAPTIAQSSNEIRFDAADVSFGARVSLAAKYCAVVVGNEAALQATDTLVGVVDLNVGGGAISSSNSAFQVQWHAEGLFKITNSAR